MIEGIHNLSKPLNANLRESKRICAKFLFFYTRRFVRFACNSS